METKIKNNTICKLTVTKNKNKLYKDFTLVTCFKHCIFATPKRRGMLRQNIGKCYAVEHREMLRRRTGTLSILYYNKISNSNSFMVHVKRRLLGLIW